MTGASLKSIFSGVGEVVDADDASGELFLGDECTEVLGVAEVFAAVEVLGVALADALPDSLDAFVRVFVLEAGVDVAPARRDVLVVFVEGVAAAELADFGAGRTCDRFTNRPNFSLHSKYLTPLTDPSFLPSGASSSTPTQSPFENSVLPKNLTTPTFPPVITRAPTLTARLIVVDHRRERLAPQREQLRCQTR